MTEEVAQRLEYLLREIVAERISMTELIELQGYGEDGLIPDHELELRQWAGVPEFPEEKPPTILDIAIARGANTDTEGNIHGDEFLRIGLPLMGGCQVCGATIAAYSSYPGTNGFLVGSCCVEQVEVFETVDAFEKWEKK